MQNVFSVSVPCSSCENVVNKKQLLRLDFAANFIALFQPSPKCLNFAVLFLHLMTYHV